MAGGWLSHLGYPAVKQRPNTCNVKSMYSFEVRMRWTEFLTILYCKIPDKKGIENHISPFLEATGADGFNHSTLIAPDQP